MKSLSLFTLFRPKEIAEGTYNIWPVSLGLTVGAVCIFLLAIVMFRKEIYRYKVASPLVKVDFFVCKFEPICSLFATIKRIFIFLFTKIFEKMNLFYRLRSLIRKVKFEVRMETGGAIVKVIPLYKMIVKKKRMFP